VQWKELSFSSLKSRLRGVGCGLIKNEGKVAKSNTKKCQRSKNDLGVDTRWRLLSEDPVLILVEEACATSQTLRFFIHHIAAWELPTTPLSPGRVGGGFLVLLHMIRF
jgi:hypothetical protein